MPIKNLSFFSNHWLLWSILAISALGGPLLNAWLGFPIPVGFDAQYSTLGGVLPYSDASSYFGSGYYFNDIGYLDSWNMRRPLNALFFIFRLHITNYNFWYAMVLQAALCIVALFIYLRTIQRDLGTLSTLIALVFIFYYAQMFAHSTLSEALGLTLGLLSFVLLWNGWTQRNRLIFNIGMASLSVALSARAGPNFMVPALFALVFFTPFTHSRFKDLCWSILSFTVPFILMMKLSVLFGDPAGSGMAYSNFASTVYGLVSGGKSWAYAYQDPSIQSLIAGKTQAQEAKILYAKSWEVFRHNPFNFSIGMVKYLGGFCYWFIRQFSFGTGITQGITTILSVIFWFLIGFKVYTKRSFFQREFLFLTIIFLGISVSSCIIWKDGGIRPFAVAIPFIGALFGFSFATPSFLKRQKVSENIWAICLVNFIVLSSVLTPYILPKKKVPDVSSFTVAELPGQKSFLVYKPATQPHILVDPSPGFHFRTISPDKLKASALIYDTLGEELKEILDKNSSNKFALLEVYDYIGHSIQYVISSTDILQSQEDWLLLRVTTTHEKTNTLYTVNNFLGLSQK
jgi:hypothetical protein